MRLHFCDAQYVSDLHGHFEGCCLGAATRGPLPDSCFPVHPKAGDTQRLWNMAEEDPQEACPAGSVSASKHAFLNQYGWRSSLSVRNFDHPCVIISCASVNIYKAYGFSFKVTVKNLPLFVLHHLERVGWLPRRLSALINQPLGIIR